MGLLDGLKHGLANAGYLTETAEHPVAPVVAPVAPTSKAITSVVSAPMVDDDVAAALTAALTASNTPVYEKYQRVVGAMQGLPEGMRVTAALSALAATDQITPQQVVEAITKRLAVLDAEQTKFEAELTAHDQSSASALQATIADVVKQVQAHQEAIAALNQQQQDASVGLVTLQQQVAQVRSQFTSTVTSMRNGLQQEQAKLTGLVT